MATNALTPAITAFNQMGKVQEVVNIGLEKGIITLIGATTENPSFEVNAALLSRCQVYVLEPFAVSDLLALVHRAVKEDEVLKKKKFEIKEHSALLKSRLYPLAGFVVAEAPLLTAAAQETFAFNVRVQK